MSYVCRCIECAAEFVGGFCDLVCPSCAQGIEAATAGETTKIGSTEGESPVGLPMRPNSGATS